MSEGTLRKRGKVWYGRIRHKGVEKERSLETDSKTVARERLGRWIRELKASSWGEKPRRTFDDAMKRFIDEHFRTVKPMTAKRYNASLIQMIDHFSGMHLDEITSQKLYDYEMKRRKKVQTPTIRRDLACLRKMFKVAQTWEWTTLEPVGPYLEGRGKSLPDHKARNRVLSHQEEANLLASAEEWAKRPWSEIGHTAPWHVIIPVAIDTGLRRNELFGLERKSSLDLDKGEIYVPGASTKSGMDRRIPILPRSRALLERHPTFLGKPWVFYRADGNRYSRTSPYLWESFKKICRNAGVEDFTIHDLRRTCGCRLLQDYRMSMEEVSLWLGHASIKVTETVYAFLRVEHLHKAVKRTSGNIVTLPTVDTSVDRVRGFSNKTVAEQRISS